MHCLPTWTVQKGWLEVRGQDITKLQLTDVDWFEAIGVLRE